MPSLDKTFLNKIDYKIEKLYPIFVETGTFKGGTIFKMEKIFQELHTIEIKHEFYLNVKNQYNGDKINFYLGDSSKVLNEIIKKLNNNCVFFLDGHFSSGNTGKGEKDCPLIEELNIIINNFKYDCIIIIDDCNLFGKGPSDGSCKENWENITEKNILKVVNKRLDKMYYLSSNDLINKKDRLILHIKGL